MYPVSVIRQCSRPGCSRPAVATLDFNYAEQTATIGPLRVLPSPHTWDLCEEHAQRTSVPQGWELHVRMDAEDNTADADEEDLLALAQAVQQAAEAKERVEMPPAPRLIRRKEVPVPTGHHPSKRNLPRHTPKRHLRAIRSEG
ncbi:DUF3499 family protein [Corynebacterium heidelbergense]|uniref:DUF3499 domain-containing protein n=1 Tax=Corynebacterium heidelbergense TaxID=2055947 RepID=A0A364V465_9CORY|nr:DUF3499 family protein [Corynebacterium heidelbergense]RAV31408.1 DUF3499 domain-containing protein [Corynebacterium heidelbergense]